MMRYLMLLTLTAGLTGGLLVPSPAFATSAKPSAGVMHVDDKAGSFSPEGIKKAEEAFHAVTFKSPTNFNVVVYRKVPEAKHADYEKAKSDPAAKKKFFGDWARELAESRGSRGVFVLISMEGGHVHAIDDRTTDARRGFGDDDLKSLEKKIAEGFVSASKIKDDAEAKAARDAGLLAATKLLADELKDTTAGSATHSARSDETKSGGSSIMSYVCIGIVALLGIWLVIGLIRAFTGGGGGGGGFGGGGYGGGGGGGFLTSMLGGMFGAAAGMYLYDQFMGHHGSDLSAGQGGDYGSNSSYDGSGDGDYAGGGDGGGTDFGDAGGGGGDYGGGDFGGGDFGGGGGDFGGGDF